MRFFKTSNDYIQQHIVGERGRKEAVRPAMYDDSDEESYVPSIRTPVMKPPEPTGLFYDNRHGDVESDDENAFPSDFGDNYVSNWQMVSSDSDLLHETMDKSQQNHNSVKTREGDNMIWHGIEEDEDSGSDYEPLPLKKEKKAMTRMRKYEKKPVKKNEYIKEIPISLSTSKSKLEIEKNTKLVNQEVLEDDDDDEDESILVASETITDDDYDEGNDHNSMYVEDFDDFDNFTAKPVPKTNTISPSKRIQKSSLRNGSDNSRNINVSNNKSLSSPTKVMGEINMDLLRDVFDSVYVDEVGVDSKEFSRLISSKLNAPNLADDVLALETETVSWSTVAVLARIYKTYKPASTAPVIEVPTSEDSSDSRKPVKPVKNISILGEEAVDTDITTTESETMPGPESSNSPVLHKAKNKPLPPAPIVDVVQDADGVQKDILPLASNPLKPVNPITKKKGVFGFTQYQTDESFNDDELDDSNDSVGDKSTNRTTPLPVSPMRVEIKRVPTIPNEESVQTGDLTAESESKNNIALKVEGVTSPQTNDTAKSTSSGGSYGVIGGINPGFTVPKAASVVAPAKMDVDDTFNIEKKPKSVSSKAELVLHEETNTDDKENSKTLSMTPLKSTTVTTATNNTPRKLQVPAPPASSLSVLKSLLPLSKLPIIEAELAESTVPFPPKLSTFALQSGVILEGWLEKKSATTGMWLKRYYVFSESETDFGVIKMYKSAVKSLWGDAPTKLKGILPISAIASIDVVPTKSANGREFTIVTNKSSQSSTSKYSNMFLNGRANFFDSGSDKGSVTSETGNGKSLLLRAPDPVTRLIWETYINGAMKLLTEIE